MNKKKLLTYEEWKSLVDSELLKLCSMTSDDLIDVDYEKYYREGKSPYTVASIVLRIAMYY
mgnify:CR=1 FL=1